MLTYSTLGLVVGGVIVASGVEPSLNLFGAAICFLGAAFRGLRAVLQVQACEPACVPCAICMRVCWYTVCKARRWLHAYVLGPALICFSTGTL